MILFSYRNSFIILMIRIHEVGMILNVEKDSLTVLTQDGNIVNVKPQEVRPRNEIKKAVGTDKNGILFGINDIVQIIDGPPIVYRKKATVMAVFRRSVFLRSIEIPENRGNYVTTSESVVVHGVKNNNDRMSSGYNNNSRGARSSGGNRGRGGPMVRMNSRVSIIKGPFKGYKGIVKHATDSLARVELMANSKIVNVEMDKLRILDEQSERTQRYIQDNDRATGWGAATPMHGGAKTPMARDAKTPAWDASSKTPGGGATSLWGSGNTPFTERMDNNTGMASNQYSALYI
jgi:transcription elongation factor SPT5